MKHLILTAAMHTILATALTAQAPAAMTPTSNWLAANRETLGATASANWLMDLDAEEMEVYVTADHAMVLVDRSPIIDDGKGGAMLRRVILGLGGTRLNLIGEVEHINDTVIHGVYGGQLGGTAVLMDQYVELRDGYPLTIVRVITRVNGSAVMETGHEELVMPLFTRPVEPDAPALTRN